MTYAVDTSVTSDRSRSEIERTLVRYGADQFMYGWGDNQAILAFRAFGRQVKFVLPLVDRTDPRIVMTPAGKFKRSDSEQEKVYEQAVRQKWRALALVIKAKLEAVEAGITVFEDEFLAHLVLPNGSTVGDWARPQIAAAYESGRMPALLPGGVK